MTEIGALQPDQPLGSLSLGRRLREERSRVGTGVAEFAASVGVSERTQRAYEAGERVPDARYLEQAMRRGLRVDYLLAGEREILSGASDAARVERAALAVLSALAERQLNVPPAKVAKLVAMAWRFIPTLAVAGQVPDGFIAELLELVEA